MRTKADDYDHSGETPEEHAAHAHEADDHDYVDHDGHEEEIEYDEHIWTSPVNAMKLVDVIGDTLAQADPAHADIYHQGAASYKRNWKRSMRAFVRFAQTGSGT